MRSNDSLLLVVEVEIVVIESRQRADDATDHRHGVSSAREAPKEKEDPLVQHCVIGDVVYEFFLLGGVRKLAMKEEVANL